LVSLHKSCKTVEIVGPEALVAVQPVHRLLHRPGGQPAGDRAAGLLPRDQAGIRQDIEMFHDRGQGHRKGLRQFAHRKALAVAEPRHQRAPCGIGERCKGAVQYIFSILNHTVKHNRKAGVVKGADDRSINLVGGEHPPRQTRHGPRKAC